MKELMPICFNKATPAQWKLMLKVILSENKKVRESNVCLADDLSLWMSCKLMSSMLPNILRLCSAYYAKQINYSRAI